MGYARGGRRRLEKRALQPRAKPRQAREHAQSLMNGVYLVTCRRLNCRVRTFNSPTIASGSRGPGSRILIRQRNPSSCRGKLRLRSERTYPGVEVARAKWAICLSYVAAAWLVAFHLDHKIVEFMRAIEQELMRQPGGNTNDVAGRDFSSNATLNRSVTFLMRPHRFPIHHRATND
jgi:hypothetical protein